MRVPGTTEGARLLGAVVAQHGPAEAGRRLGASPSAVRSWVKGQRSPTGAARKALASTFAIPAESWASEPAGATAPPAAAREEATAASPAPEAARSAKDRAVDQVARIVAEIARAKDAGAGWRDLAALERTYTSALRNLGRLSGELEVSESQILRSAAWARLMRIVQGVLEHHPAIARELATAIERVGGGES